MVKKLLAFIILLTTLLLGTAYFFSYRPRPIENEAVIYSAKLPELKPGQRLKIMTWNVQFMAGNQYNCFFFEKHCHDPWPSMNTYQKILHDVINTIKTEDPDFVLLQEVDVDSKRSHYIDQINALTRALPQYANFVSTHYWYSLFVPHPSIWGKQDLRLVILSKYKIAQAIRYQLPLPPDNFLNDLFNERRAILQAILPITGSNRVFNLLTTHFNAYAYSDAMFKQVQFAKNIIGEASGKGPTLIGGDFNLLPPEAKVNFETSDHSFDFFNRKDYELKMLYTSFQGIPMLKELKTEHEKDWFTNQSPYPLKRGVMDKTIDYFFVSHDIEIDQHYVKKDNNVGMLSDHIPLITYITLPNP